MIALHAPFYGEKFSAYVTLSLGGAGKQNPLIEGHASDDNGTIWWNWYK